MPKSSVYDLVHRVYTTSPSEEAEEETGKDSENDEDDDKEDEKEDNINFDESQEITVIFELL